MDNISFLYTNSAAPLRRIKFVPAKLPDTVAPPEGVEILYLSCTPLQADTKSMPKAAPSPSSQKSGLRELFREEDVKRAWTAVRRVGAGLQNLGNTCFMNSVLQCLTHTPPLAENLLQSRPLRNGQNGFNALRITQEHMLKVLQGRLAVVSPVTHVKTLRRISRSFCIGRQEDAHEYLIALLDAMHESLLEGFKPKPSASIQETSMIFRIFAGRIRSQVKCAECGYESNTVEPFLDISLEITGANTLEKALQRFTATEYLEGDNKYKCPKQACLVRAAKRMSVEKAPNVLVIQLKRFEFSMYGQKLTKKVEFETSLDLGPYMSDRRSPPQMYELYGVLVHHGHSVHSGHYYCFVRAPNGLWHQMDDSSVSQVSERVVLAQKAYILFYIRKDVAPLPSLPTSPRAAAKQAVKPSQTAPSPGKRKRNSLDSQPGRQKQRQKENAGQDDPKQQEEKSVEQRMTSSAVDAEVLRERLASHTAAAPSQPQRSTPFAAVNGDPQSSGQHRQRTRQVVTRSALKNGLRDGRMDAAMALLGGTPAPKKLYGRSWRHYQIQKRLASRSLHTPPTAGSPGLRGTSPLHLAVPRGIAGKPVTRSRFRSAAPAEPQAFPVTGREAEGLPNGPAEKTLPRQATPKAGEQSMEAQEKANSGAGLSLEQEAQAMTLCRSDVSAREWPPSGIQASSKAGAEGANGVSSPAKRANGMALPAKRANGVALPAKRANGVALSAKEANGVSLPNKRARLSSPVQHGTDSTELQEVLGLANGGPVGPSGEQHWNGITDDVKQQADEFLRAMEPILTERDQYDQEYDMGKTKKVKGMNQPNDWHADGDNIFQNAWNSRGRGRSGGKGRVHNKQGKHEREGDKRGGRHRQRGGL